MIKSKNSRKVLYKQNKKIYGELHPLGFLPIVWKRFPTNSGKKRKICLLKAMLKASICVFEIIGHGKGITTRGNFD